MKVLEWKQAMDAEIVTLERNETWEVVPLPPENFVISCKWVFKLKPLSSGLLERYKTRLVMKGFLQALRID